ncbi:YhgE/Pip-like protein [Desulfosporosinus orientis DSM 765]|uniref:YhgE/Pip-like protein n=1 Tax=Desulfosporosinus orientis (strain ATCC 19365 / DSM 765 / NCIMB 8382 / VKM B-1628 / Singapore I) TaxID=768706 RepID=G7WF11_DESOD|nr:YhgE/Pip domain-containing protein [Desulfosporosinus orientis]AET67622.1 YhgE/Pip-like protein [Desulfosporosinus orientis DSM 765]
MSKKVFQFLNKLKNGIRPIFLVFLHDIRAIARNPAALLIIIGLSVLPSLYAWINIYACWDPYANTGNLPVAIINNDEGAVFNGQAVNVGDSVIDALKENKSIGWSFIDDWQGNYGLNEGKYYALIEIPRNFSTGLISMATPTPQKPVLTYRVNEKLNAIASKITNVAKDNLVSNIQTNFVKTVSTEVMKILQKGAQEGNFNNSQIGKLESTLREAQDNITKTQAQITAANADALQLQTYLQNAGNAIPILADQIDNLQKVMTAGKSLVLSTQQTIQRISAELNTDLGQVQVLDNQNQALISVLKTMNGNTLNQDEIGILKQTIRLCSSTHALLQTDQKTLEALSESYDLTALTFLANSIRYLDRLVQDEYATLNKILPLVEKGSAKSEIDAALNALSGISSELSDQIQTVANTFYSQGSPALNTLVSNLSVQVDDTTDILEITKALLPQLNALAAFCNASSKLSVQQANQLAGLLTELQDNLTSLSGKIAYLTGMDIDRIMEIVQNHPGEVADFLASPIDIKEIDIYAGGTFGVGLTPFYTVLAIWVGALLACALLTVECKDKINGIPLNLKQRHLGKMLLFLSLSLIQSTIITLGDILILGIHPASFSLMLAFSVLSSLTFTIMLFTLVSVFGNVGKAIAVVIMVFQIAGAGGIYPIQTNPKIFGVLEPLWPFTYAINGFREAIAGPVWSSVHHNLLALSAFAGVFLLLGALKKPFHWLNHMMSHKFEEAEL